jgi:hypothetical protein
METFWIVPSQRIYSRDTLSKEAGEYSGVLNRVAFRV